MTSAIEDYLKNQFTELSSYKRLLEDAADEEEKKAAAIQKAECYIRIIRIADVIQKQTVADFGRQMLKLHLTTYPEAVQAACSAIAHDSVIIKEDEINDLVLEACTGGRSGSGKRSVKTSPGSPDQVNDKTSRSKAGQLNRVYDKYQFVTTPTVDGSKNWGRTYSVIFTFNECKPNQGGGDRSSTQRAEDKKLRVPQVVVRATDDAILTDGRMCAAFQHAARFFYLHKGKPVSGMTREQEITLNRHLGNSPMNVLVALNQDEYESTLFGKGSIPKKRTSRGSPAHGGFEDDDTDILGVFSDDALGKLIRGENSGLSDQALGALIRGGNQGQGVPGATAPAPAPSTAVPGATAPAPAPSAMGAAQQQPAAPAQQQPAAPAQQQPAIILQQTPSPFGASPFVQMMPQPSPMQPHGLFQQIPPRCPNGTLCTIPNCRFSHY